MLSSLLQSIRYKKLIHYKEIVHYNELLHDPLILDQWFRESDKDKNRMISFQEFLAETERDEFEKVNSILVYLYCSFTLFAVMFIHYKFLITNLLLNSKGALVQCTLYDHWVIAPVDLAICLDYTYPTPTYIMWPRHGPNLWSQLVNCTIYICIYLGREIIQ